MIYTWLYIAVSALKKTNNLTILCWLCFKHITAVLCFQNCELKTKKSNKHELKRLISTGKEKKKEKKKTTYLSLLLPNSNSFLWYSNTAPFTKSHFIIKLVFRSSRLIFLFTHWLNYFISGKKGLKRTFSCEYFGGLSAIKKISIKINKFYGVKFVVTERFGGFQRTKRGQRFDRLNHGLFFCEVWN